MKKLFTIYMLFCFSAITFAAEVIDINVNNLEDPRVALEELKIKVNRAFDKMETDLASAAKELSFVGLSGPEAKKILNNLCKGKNYAIDCAAIDPNGVMLSVEPENFKEFQGKDISNQEHFIRLFKTKKPAISDVFLSVEGVNAIDFQYPVFSRENEFIGAVSLLMRYEDIFSPIIMPVVRGGPFDVWIIQKDGLTLYDPDKEEIGRNVFQDPMYKPFPSYVALCKQIAEEDSGFGSYNFLDKGLKNPVNKDAAWTTIGWYGIEWRMVVVRERRIIGQ